MWERKMIEIYQEIHSHLNEPATVHLLKEEAPALLEYMGLWKRDLGDMILASRKISLFNKVILRIVKAFGFGDRIPRDILLALVIRSGSSEVEAQIDPQPPELCSGRVKKFQMREPELPANQSGNPIRQALRGHVPARGYE